MKTINKKIALTALLTIATIVTIPVHPFSFSLATLQNSSLSVWFSTIQRPFSRLFSLAAQKQASTQTVCTQAPFVEKVQVNKIDKTATPTSPDFNLSIFKLKPKSTANCYYDITYVKTTDQSEKELVKKVLLGGNLAPSNVIHEINKTLTHMRQNTLVRREEIIKRFAHGPIELKVSIEKYVNNFELTFTILEKDTEIGFRTFPFTFEHITEKNGTSYERVNMSMGDFRVKPPYGQKGFGHYLFSLQIEFAKLQKNAQGKIYPCPEAGVCMLQTLKDYYGSFGFIKHPIYDYNMIISFRDGKLDPALELFKAIYNEDVTAVEKLLKNGLSIDATLDGIPALLVACTNTNLLKLLITKYDALKNLDNLDILSLLPKQAQSAALEAIKKGRKQHNPTVTKK